MLRAIRTITSRDANVDLRLSRRPRPCDAVSMCVTSLEDKCASSGNMEGSDDYIHRHASRETVPVVRTRCLDDPRECSMDLNARYDLSLRVSSDRIHMDGPDEALPACHSSCH